MKLGAKTYVPFSSDKLQHKYKNTGTSLGTKESRKKKNHNCTICLGRFFKNRFGSFFPMKSFLVTWAEFVNTLKGQMG
jgi:hypothetical protein